MQFYKVKSVEETLQIIEQNVRAIRRTKMVPIEEAYGCVLATDIVSPESVPGFNRSTVDGYAVQSQDTYGSSESSPQFLQVSGEVHMGEKVSQTLQTGQAMYIPTGGMLPPGSDSVIMIEYCENMDGLLNTYKQVAPGENVISSGEDVQQSQQLLHKGTRLRPQELGILASVGITEVQVYDKVKVGYLSSGDEIVPYQTQGLRVGEVRDMNEVTLSAFVQEWGGEVVQGGIVQDDYDLFQAKARELYEQTDVLVLSGGSSVGEKDYTTEVIQSLGEPGVLVHGVSVKPGKPTIFSMAAEKPVLGLPGHPASAVVIFQLFGHKMLQHRQGEIGSLRPERYRAKVTQNLSSAPGRSDYIRAKWLYKDEQWWVQPVLGKSGLLSTLVKSDGLIEIDSQKEGVQEGDWVNVLLLR